MTTQDFEKGLDLTGITPVTAADVNQAIDLSSPASDKGILLVNRDVTLDVPTVPDATVISQSKWKRYLWLRIPHATATNTLPKLYAWNDYAISDAVMLKWQNLFLDISSYDAGLSTLASSVALLMSNFETLDGKVTTILVDLADIKIDITDLNTTILNLTTSVTTALADAAAAKTVADSAKEVADAVAVTASAKRDPAAALTPGTSLQQLRTNAGATSVEWFSPSAYYAKLSETKAKGTDAGDAAAGANIRQLVEDYDTGNLVSANAGLVTIAVAGTYYLKGWCAANPGGDGTSTEFQLFLMKSDDTVLFSGQGHLHPADDRNVFMEVSGVYTFAANDIIKLVLYTDQVTNTYGLGRAVNLAPTGGKEVYAELEIIRIC